MQKMLYITISLIGFSVVESLAVTPECVKVVVRALRVARSRAPRVRAREEMLIQAMRADVQEMREKSLLMKLELQAMRAQVQKLEEHRIAEHKEKARARTELLEHTYDRS